jgi:hypothetical protein
MSNLSDYLEAAGLNWAFTTQSVTRPTAWFVSLHTAAPGESGTGEIGTGSGYARQAATFASAVAGVGTTDNTNSMVFGPASVSNWGVVSGVAVWDATTAGNCLMQGTFATARTINIDDQLTIATGALDLTLA